MKNKEVYSSIRTILENARAKAYQAVNFAMVEAYWEIGRIIVEEEQKGKKRADYGKALLKDLSRKLTQDFGRGFDESNLRYIRIFYLSFPIRDALRHELSWTHYRLLCKVEDKKAKEFYLEEAVEGNWSTRQLERQINSFYHQRLLATQDKYKEDVKKEIHEKEKDFDPRDIVKDPYVLEFLGVKDGHKLQEDKLEALLIDKLQNFLLELGKGFCFIDRQKRITLDGDHFFVDLVFYNHILKCFVLIELKTGKLTHENIGQMDFYVRYYEKEIRQKDDNPTIGIILCTDKNEAMVKYSLLGDSKNLFASKYKSYLPTTKELEEEILEEKKRIEQEKRFK